MRPALADAQDAPTARDVSPVAFRLLIALFVASEGSQGEPVAFGMSSAAASPGAVVRFRKSGTRR